MLPVQETATVEEASQELLAFVLEPSNWVMIDQLWRDPNRRPGENPKYQRRVGGLRICASVDVTPTLDVFLRVAFSGPGLSPMKAADHLEEFLKPRMPLIPNSEWDVQVDGRKWIHFMRRYIGKKLEA